MILCIKQLQNSKIHWFTAETIKGSIYAILSLSHCYQLMHLNYAAKYYAAMAVRIINIYNLDELNELLPQSLYQLTKICFYAGEWFLFIQILKLAILTHITFDNSPLLLNEHDELSELLSLSCIVRVSSMRFNPQLSTYIEETVSHWSLDQDLKNELDDLINDTKTTWNKQSDDSLFEIIQAELSAKPFSDLGNKRKLEWKALGITWCIEFENKYNETILAEHLAALLQISLVDMAEYDLVLLPTKVKIVCEINNHSKINFIESPSNEISIWKITCPVSLITSDDSREYENTIFGLAMTILFSCSVLPKMEFSKRFKKVTTNGLYNATFFGRPFSECYSHVIYNDGNFEEEIKKSNSPLFLDRSILPKEHPLLVWQTSTGWNYSKSKANALLKKRYKNAIIPIKLTLKKLLLNLEFRNNLKALKKDGNLDWQILSMIAFIAINYRAQKLGYDKLGRKEIGIKTKALMNEKDTENSIDIPIEMFLNDAFEIQKDMLAVTVTSTWGLQIKQRTPDFKAIKMLMDIRYRNSVDDIEHEDPWGIEII